MEEFKMEKGLTKTGMEILDIHAQYYNKTTLPAVKDVLWSFVMSKRDNGLAEAFKQDDPNLLIQYLMSKEKYLKQEEHFITEAINYVDSYFNPELKLTILPKGKNIIIQKRIGIKPEIAKKIFNVKHTGFLKLYSSDFITTFMDKYIKTQLENFIHINYKLKYPLEFSDVYTVTERKIINIDVNISMKLNDISINNLNDVSMFLEKLNEKIKELQLF